VKKINIKELLAKFEGYSSNLDVTASDITSKNDNHRHKFIIDKNGDGVALLVVHPSNPKIKHKHLIKNYVVLEAQSDCYPDCKSKYGSAGSSPHGHIIKKEVSPDAFTTNSSTSEVYNSRANYKEQVNKKNLPIGEQTSDGKVLKNQLDLWYERPHYGKYDSSSNLIKLKDSNLKTVGDTELLMLDFASDATDAFLEQYNIERDTHPQSKLNDLKVIKAYEPPVDYETYFLTMYVRFFNDVLDKIKKTDKIKNVHDFIRLFYLWASSNNFPITETGFYESRIYNIYNTGLAFDFLEINSESDKQKILNDVRFPVLNYVAKVNGLRIDPNYPARLIVDIYSKPLLTGYASNYIFGPIEDTPNKILESYFSEVDFSDSSEDKIASFLKNISNAYNRFILKYPNYATYQFDDNDAQFYKRRFQTSKVDRLKDSYGIFFNEMKATPDGTALFQSLSKNALEQYVKFRLLETNTQASKRQIKKIVGNMFVMNTISNKLDFVEMQSVEKLRYISSQAINYLESFMHQPPAKNKAQVKTKKRNFVYLWSRGIQKIH
tara:strand:- start:695 stop:2341 length:1647 start_codon:yes stop_codon:yes gene_type:complete